MREREEGEEGGREEEAGWKEREERRERKGFRQLTTSVQVVMVQVCSFVFCKIHRFHHHTINSG